MNRTAATVVLLLLGIAVVKVCLTGHYLRYVKEGLWPFLLASGVLVLILAVTNRHCHPKVAWLLPLPVLALPLVAPQPLGSYAAGNAGTALTRSDEYPPLPDGDPVKVTVLDYASRAVFDEGRSLGSRRVVLTGFTTSGPDGGSLLVRMILTCCAADGGRGQRRTHPVPQGRGRDTGTRTGTSLRVAREVRLLDCPSGTVP